MRRITLLSLVLVGACASSSGVVQMGPNSYFASKQAATGFPGLGNLKADLIQQASQFCAQRGGSIAIIRTDETQPPYILGNYPRVELQFECVRPGPS